MKQNRGLSLLFTVAIYLLATVVGLYAYRALRMEPVYRLLAADIAATVVIYLVSVPLGNASVYDPYWSVAPVVMLPFAISKFGVWNAGSAALLVCVTYWGVRLTANWAYTFHGYAHQDWRYTMLQKKSGAFFPLVSLMGIMLFPTLVVYFCLLPALFYVQTGGINALTCVGFALCLSAATLQLVADAQLHRFQRTSHGRGAIIRTGVWKNARHPNYLGEILMWWGVYLVLLSVQPQLWPLGIGALTNTLMFLFISIPMAENRLAGYKEGFADYIAETNRLLPIKRNK